MRWFWRWKLLGVSMMLGVGVATTVNAQTSPRWASPTSIPVAAQTTPPTSAEKLAPPNGGSAAPSTTEMTTKPNAATLPIPQGSCATDASCFSSNCDLISACCPTPCGPAGRVWVSADYLLFWFKGADTPPLVTTSPAGTPRTSSGVLGAPGTVILFGGTTINEGPQSGWMFRAGGWLNQCQTIGIEGSFYFFSNGGSGSGDGFSIASPGGLPQTSRPFIDLTTGVPILSAQLVGLPGVLSGSVTVDSSTSLTGGGANLLYNVCCSCCSRTDLLLGWWTTRLAEELNITENLITQDTSRGAPVGTNIIVSDRFRTENTFNGVLLGVAHERRGNGWFISGRAAVALGNVHSVVQIAGSTVVTPPGGPSAVRSGGLLAQNSNIGTYTSDDFAVMPMVGLNAGLWVTEKFRVYAGYNFWYLSEVVRPGDQIDLGLNTNFLSTGTASGGPMRPTFIRNATDFWAHGLNFGAELRF